MNVHKVMHFTNINPSSCPLTTVLLLTVPNESIYVTVNSALDPFPTIKEPKVHRPTIGLPLTLTCQPPMSYPVGTVYWGETKNGPKLRPIENTQRISLDYDGKRLSIHDVIVTSCIEWR